MRLEDDLIDAFTKAFIDRVEAEKAIYATAAHACAFELRAHISDAIVNSMFKPRPKTQGSRLLQAMVARAVACNRRLLG